MFNKPSGSALFGNAHDSHWPGQSESTVKGQIAFTEFSIQ